MSSGSACGSSIGVSFVASVTCVVSISSVEVSDLAVAFQVSWVDKLGDTRRDSETRVEHTPEMNAAAQQYSSVSSTSLCVGNDFIAQSFKNSVSG